MPPVLLAANAACYYTDTVEPTEAKALTKEEQRRVRNGRRGALYPSKRITHTSATKATRAL